MGEILTLEELERISTFEIACPELSKRAGREVCVRARMITSAELALVWPPPIEGSEEWKPEEREERVREYQASLSPAERQTKAREWLEVDYQILVLALIEPRVTQDQSAQRFGPDTSHIVRQILIQSGLTAPEVPAPPEPPA